MFKYTAEPRLYPEEAVPGARVHVPDRRSGTIVGWTNGTITHVLGTQVDPTGSFIVRLDSTGTDALYCGYSLGPVVGEQATLPGLGA